MKNRTKLLFKDITDKSITFGKDTVLEYLPENWRVIKIVPVYSAGSPKLQRYTITIREVAAI
jgi:hypothetical protein